MASSCGFVCIKAKPSSATPLVVYAHGGGFVTGNLDTDHAHCVELAREAGCLVVSVDYRLAPEYPCPAALDDVEAGFRYAVQNCADLNADASRVARDGSGCGRRTGRGPGPAHVRRGRSADPGTDPAPADARLRRHAVAARVPAHAGPQRSCRQPGVGPLPRPRQRERSTRPRAPGEPRGPASHVHHLLRDRPVPRRSHRLRQPAAACLRPHRVARCRSDIQRLRLVVPDWVVSQENRALHAQTLRRAFTA